MHVTGSHTLAASPKQVWDALHDPEVLVRTIPGCQRLEETGEGVYAASVRAGVASITGTYAGQVRLLDGDEPQTCTLRAEGQGGPGTVDATARITLSEDGPGSTRVTYDADAAVGGAIAGVGQRVLAGVTKRNASEFFDALETYLAGGLAQPEPEQAEAVGPEGAPGPETRTRVYEAPAPTGAGPGDPRLLLAAGVAGAAIALAGVAVGRRAARA